MSNTPDALRFAYRGPHTIGQVAWSPNGTLLATGNAAGQFQVWDAVTGQEQVCVQIHETWVSVSALSWSPNSTQILSSGIDGRIAIYDLQRAETQTLYQYPPSYDSEEVAGTNQAGVPAQCGTSQDATGLTGQGQFLAEPQWALDAEQHR